MTGLGDPFGPGYDPFGAQPATPSSCKHRIPIAGMPQGQQEAELALLYNHADNDSPQFTRWQMMTAIAHGYRLAVEDTSTPDSFDAAAFSLELRLAMARANLSYRQLAEKIGCDQANIHRVAKHGKAPSVGSYVRMRRWIAAIGIEAAKPARQLAGSTEGESPVDAVDAPIIHSEINNLPTHTGEG